MQRACTPAPSAARSLSSLASPTPTRSLSLPSWSHTPTARPLTPVWPGSSPTWKPLAALPRVFLGPRALSDLDLIAVGAFSPLDGFLGRRDYESVLERMRLANGLPWSLPITLAVSPAEAEPLEEGREV